MVPSYTLIFEDTAYNYSTPSTMVWYFVRRTHDHILFQPHADIAINIATSPSPANNCVIRSLQQITYARHLQVAVLIPLLGQVLGFEILDDWRFIWNDLYLKYDGGGDIYI